MLLNGNLCASFPFQIVVEFPRTNYMKTSVKKWFKSPMSSHVREIAGFF